MRQTPRKTRSRPYLVDVGDGNEPCRVPAHHWLQWVAVGALVVIDTRLAKPARPGSVWIENGELHSDEPIAPWMLLNCRMIERHAIYDQRGASLTPGEVQREIQAQYVFITATQP